MDGSQRDPRALWEVIRTISAAVGVKRRDRIGIHNPVA